ncbi:porphobilinogen synthase [Maridesulfovibrio salexigens]|uniref:Delta-aminolevulinic acid dehydratase n=1 Tax=Maridesulfovibrio salexigens (strain ATCC 14822 / DSM 2638 / NCIMB 8403 / VKM B-1763) TaxID=526222 RepID=C6C1Q8_MARSD|nr:porphobilinogen synthase [Maridesulfovibrio salexigens]ACS79304.1 Porphobilinogen synthase [Maridesulfovibrio salexigens DSM 2638]
MVFDFHRGRRLRRTPVIRDLIRETTLSANDLMMPYFVYETDDENFKKEVSSMPGQFQLSLKQLEIKVEEAVANGLKSLILFGIPAEKDPAGSQAYAEDGIVQQAVRMLKKRWPELLVCTDVCLCEFTSHGHCGLVKDEIILNDATLELLAKTALSHAKAGADMVAPSDMMDGRVAAIREILDENGFAELPLMSYAVKYASAYYGPFREAAEGAPQFGDRKTYQMDPANAREGLREAAADVIEGADILMVKPAGPYMDIIRQTRDNFDLPVAAYQVSGEYSMIKAAALNGWVDEESVVWESLIGLKRAGADLILTYFTEDVLKRLKEK